MTRVQEIPGRKHLSAIRGYGEVVRELLESETVIYNGQVVRVWACLLGRRGHREAIDVPILADTSSPGMLEITGESGDGVHHFFFNPGRLLAAVSAAGQEWRGAARTGRSMEDIDMPRMLKVAMADHAETTRNAARHSAPCIWGNSSTSAEPAGCPQRLFRSSTMPWGMASQAGRNQKGRVPGGRRHH